MCIRNTGKAVVGLHLEAERSQQQPGGDQAALQTFLVCDRLESNGRLARRTSATEEPEGR